MQKTRHSKEKHCGLVNFGEVMKSQAAMKYNDIRDEVTLWPLTIYKYEDMVVIGYYS